MLLSGRALLMHAQSPGFNLQYHIVFEARQVLWLFLFSVHVCEWLCMWAHTCHGIHTEVSLPPALFEEGLCCSPPSIPTSSQGNPSPLALSHRERAMPWPDRWETLHPACGVLGTQTQVFTYAQQVLDPLSHLPVPTGRFQGSWGHALPSLYSQEASTPTVRWVHNAPTMLLLPRSLKLQRQLNEQKFQTESKPALPLYQLIVSGFLYSYTRLMKLQT